MLFRRRRAPEPPVQEEELEGGGHEGPATDLEEPDPRNRSPSTAPSGGGARARAPGEGPNRSHRSKSSGTARAENTYGTIYGHKGFGKTTLARTIWKARTRAGGSGVWIDGSGANPDLGTVVSDADALARTLERSLEAGRPFAVVLQPGWDPDLSRVWRLLYDVGRHLLVLDDCQAFANAQRIDPDLHNLVSWGRNQEIDLLTTVRTPPEAHGVIKGLTDVAYTFRQTKRHYARVLEREFFHLEDAAERILALPRFHYLRAEAGEVTFGRVTPGT